MNKQRLGTYALRTLAVVRIVNGALGLLAPAVLVRRTSTDPLTTEPYYAFRMFGIRTLILGFDLLALKGPASTRARAEALIIHGSDTVCAVVGGRRGDLPPKAATITTAISAVNTVLAAIAFVGRKG